MPQLSAQIIDLIIIIIIRQLIRHRNMSIKSLQGRLVHECCKVAKAGSMPTRLFIVFVTQWVIMSMAMDSYEMIACYD